MNDRPYVYRAKIARRIQTPTFELGKGVNVVLNLASKNLIKLLRTSYKKDPSSLELSQASLTFLMNEFGDPRDNETIPSIAVPKAICFQPKIIS